MKKLIPNPALEREARDAAINLRAPRSWLDLVDRAADMIGKGRTEFILESAWARTVDILLGQRLFALEPGRYEAFVAALDAPLQPNEKLRRLLNRKAAWEG
jgi:uncharacterized protein (DUF1778 family)